MKHVIIARVNIPRDLDPSNHKRPAPYKKVDWNHKRMALLNKFLRPSLRQQTNQNFEFVSLWGPQAPVPTDDALPNEKMLLIEKNDYNDAAGFDFEQWREDPSQMFKTEMDHAFQIKYLMKEHYEGQEPILFTNIDSDDCLKKNFVEKIQLRAERLMHRELATKQNPIILDIEKRYMYNPKTGAKGQRIRRTPSPAPSSLEWDIECYPLRWHHSMMLDYLPENISYEKIKGLLIMQSVTGNNILTSGTGNSAEFNLKDFF